LQGGIDGGGSMKILGIDGKPYVPKQAQNVPCVRFNQRTQKLELLPERIVCGKCRRWAKRGTAKAVGWAMARCPTCLAKENPPGRVTYVEMSHHMELPAPRFSCVVEA
jgi:hypothetical protein